MQFAPSEPGLGIMSLSSAQHFSTHSQAHFGQYGYPHSRLDDHYVNDPGKGQNIVDSSLLNHPFTSSGYSLPPLGIASPPGGLASPVTPLTASPTDFHQTRTFFSESPTLNGRDLEPDASRESNEGISLASSHIPSTLRYIARLDARTAISTRPDEATMTYLNKSQNYTLFLQSSDYAGDVTCTVRLMFHEPRDQAKQSTLWRMWLKLHHSTSRVIEAETASAVNAYNFEQLGFDRVRFQWNAAQGAHVQLRFNCLSTDFSMIKGVKGIPLRLHVSNRVEGVPHTSEACYCRVKLFRDKGACRKHKDDLAQIKKQMKKMKEADAPMPTTYLGSQHTLLVGYTPDELADVMDDEYGLDISEMAQEVAEEDGEGDFEPVPSLVRRRKFSALEAEPLDYDPTYVPVKKRKKVLCLFVKRPKEVQYRAIYLHQISLEDLIAKIAEKFEFDAFLVGQVMRYTSQGLTVRVDKGTIEQLNDETPITIELLRPAGVPSFSSRSCTLAMHF
ncbi:uncharacterized protein VTP21DRAFT_9979 [Calcarisporiella thermophila]|uniref:uncharacterized protein n=1 Tax=Calcarisporiella thermophila TaxID=911321 RepID=UPI003741FD98